jgi:hypothetical protein
VSLPLADCSGSDHSTLVYLVLHLGIIKHWDMETSFPSALLLSPVPVPLRIPTLLEPLPIESSLLLINGKA